MSKRCIRYPVSGHPYRSWTFPYEDDISMMHSISLSIYNPSNLQLAQLRGKLYDLEDRILSDPFPRSIQRHHAEKLIRLYRLARFGMPLSILELECRWDSGDFHNQCSLRELCKGSDLARPRRLNGYYVGDGSFDPVFGHTIRLHPVSPSDTFLSLAIQGAVIGASDARALLSAYKELTCPRWFVLIKIHSNGVFVNMHLAFRNRDLINGFGPSNEAEIGYHHSYREPWIVKYPSMPLSEANISRAIPITDKDHGSVSWVLRP